MKCRKKCELFQACSESSAGELLTTSPQFTPQRDLLSRSAGKKGGGSKGCEDHRRGAAPGKTWIGFSAWHCPRPHMERGFLGCQRTEGLCAWPPCSLPALSSSVSVHMPSLLPADAWLAQPPSTSQLLPGLPAVNPPQPPHTATAAAPQLSFPHS